MECRKENIGKINVFDVGLFLLIFMTSTVIMTSLFFFVGVTVNVFSLIISLIISILFTYFIKKSIKDTVIITMSAVMILMILILISSAVYDNTWDGAAYHKQAVGFLKEGWNPIAQKSIDFNALSGSITYKADNPMLWAEAYPKSAWYFAASIYKLTNNIESGKVYTLLFMIITLGIFYDYLKVKKIKRWQAIIASTVAALNPIAIAQFQSYYVDGMAVNVLMSLMLIFTAYYDKDYRRSKIEKNVIILSLIIFGCNLKFSILLFTATYCIVFFIYTGIRNYKANDIQGINKMLVSLASSSLFSLLVIGFSPYITNIKRYQNPFYGFIGERNLAGAEQAAQSFGFGGLNNIQMFLTSLFGKMSHGEYKSVSTLLKIPFTFDKVELSYYNLVDTRVGGLGVLYSGIFLISLIIVIFAMIKLWKRKNIEFNLIIIFSFISFIEFMILPMSFQFRYVGHIYITTVLALVILFVYCNKRKITHITKEKVLIIFLLMSIVANCAPWIKAIEKRIKVSNDTTAVFNKLKQESTKGNIKIALYCSDFTGINYNLKDFNINNTIVPYEKIDETYNRTFYDWVLYKIEK